MSATTTHAATAAHRPSAAHRSSAATANARTGASTRTATARAWFPAAVLALTAAAVALRLYHQTTAYELFVDEIQYADLANAWAAGQGQELFGQPFFLHPPLFFALVGLLSAAVGHGPVAHLTVQYVLGLRWVELGFAAVNVVLVVTIVRKLVGRRAALTAGVLYALDPFVIRFDSRLMLEAPMMTFVLAGLLAAMVAADADAGGRARTLLLVAAGVAFGLALTTKSTSALVSTAPLLLMLVTGWGLGRIEAVLVLVTQGAVYSAYLAGVLLTEHGAAWWTQTVSGVARVSGAATQTGFNAVGKPPITDRIVADLPLFGPSYVLIAIAVVYGGRLLFTGLRSRRIAPGWDSPGQSSGDLFLVWLTGVGATLAYTFLFGELEEQTFYLLVVPSTVVGAMLAARLAARSRGLGLTAACGVTTIAAGAGLVWWQVHTVPDDTYLRLSAALSANAVPRGSSLALGEYTAQFVLPGYDLRALAADGTAAGAHYALVSTELSTLSLAPVPIATVTTLSATYPVVFSASGRTAGELRLYDLSRRVAR